MLLVFVSSLLPARPQTISSSIQDEVALSAATQELCPVQVAMLGEAANHGDSHTIAFKVALVERLVDQCGFDSVFFEANHDGFIERNRRLRLKQPVTQDDLLSAVGGIWKFYREFQQIASYLLEQAESGGLFPGGIDDQLGQLGQDYANVGMIAEWTKLLPLTQSRSCGTALHRRIYGDYTDAAPYSRADRSQIDTCLSEMQAASDAGTAISRVEGEERREMISATQRWIARDFELD